MNLSELERLCAEFIAGVVPADSGHDLGHVCRVVRNVDRLTVEESADAWITLPAAWLHDCVAIAKDSPLRSKGSQLAAEAAAKFLQGIGYPQEKLDAVRHAIEAHSFSAAIPTRSLEAQVVQDGDRLDSLGAIGIARCLLVGGKLNRSLCAADDPFCETREPDDGQYTIDHFYTKLFKLPAMMQTKGGKAEAQRRVAIMRDYLDELRAEITRA
ncbi:MAG: HD domain-containing protein [Xanthomonadales bacterium]|nr:HD domain-containing protein [Xanthomonadales bacterium]